MPISNPLARLATAIRTTREFRTITEHPKTRLSSIYGDQSKPKHGSPLILKPLMLGSQRISARRKKEELVPPFPGRF
jgi:hypothetical protein